MLFSGSLAGWFFLHLWFLSADPGLHIGPSRDAWTDEGLYTAQIRNYIHHNKLSVDENPTFFKAPFFNLLLAPFFYLFGTTLETARLVVLCFITFGILYLARKTQDRIFFVIAIYTVFCHTFLFTYAHLAMAEMVGIMFIVSGIHFLASWPVSDSLMGRMRVMLGVQLLMGLAFLSKAMYGYMLVFVPAVLLIWAILRMFRNLPGPRKLLSYVFISVMAVALFVVLYWICWVIPNNSLALKIWEYEGISRFAAARDMPGTIKFWILNIYLDPLHAFHTWMFLGMGAIFLVLMAMKKVRPGWTGFLWWMWFLFELYKLLLTDQPPRYQLSLLASMGFLVAYMIRCIQLSGNRWAKLSCIILVSLFAGKFAGDIRWMVSNRSYTIREANTYLGSITGPGDTVMGVWAGSAGWQTSAYILPVWSGYVNDKDILGRFHPDVIISEPGQEDSGGAFHADGITLDSNAAKKMRVGYWDLHFYQIPEK